MKVKFILFVCLLALHMFALDPPPPVKGVPTFFSGKNFTTQSGDTIFSFAFPANWGIGRTSASGDSASFTLFPQDGSFGSVVEIQRFSNEMLANQEVERLKATFKSTSPIDNGFESMLKKAYYACYTNELYVVQIWYSLASKRSAQSDTNWSQLKQCVSVSEAKKEVKDETWTPVKEIPRQGWVCNHPNNQLHVLLKSNYISPTKPNQDLKANYLLEIGDINSSGFFFVKWDQENLKSVTPYELHLKEMKAEILKLESGQKFEGRSEIMQEEGWAFLRGSPYTIVSISGEEFLFGFALKNNNKFISFDINDYIKRVEWWKD
jgi:hypothetical protein